MVKINNKRKMYQMLQRGQLGNTIRQFTCLDSFLAYALHQPPELRWAVRAMQPGGEFVQNLDIAGVKQVVAMFINKHERYNISEFLNDRFKVKLFAETCFVDNVFHLYGFKNPPKGANWRLLMPTQGKQYSGYEALSLLMDYANDLSRDMIMGLHESYPNHVVEFSILDAEYGTIPGHNAIIWEVRNY